MHFHINAIDAESFENYLRNRGAERVEKILQERAGNSPGALRKESFYG